MNSIKLHIYTTEKIGYYILLCGGLACNIEKREIAIGPGNVHCIQQLQKL